MDNKHLLETIKKEFNDLYYNNIVKKGKEKNRAIIYTNDYFAEKLFGRDYIDVKHIYLPVIGKVDIILDNSEDLYTLKVKANG